MACSPPSEANTGRTLPPAVSLSLSARLGICQPLMQAPLMQPLMAALLEEADMLHERQADEVEMARMARIAKLKGEEFDPADQEVRGVPPVL
jgi:hypothetical protein